MNTYVLQRMNMQISRGDFVCSRLIAKRTAAAYVMDTRSMFSRTHYVHGRPFIINDHVYGRKKAEHTLQQPKFCQRFADFHPTFSHISARLRCSSNVLVTLRRKTNICTTREQHPHDRKNTTHGTAKHTHTQLTCAHSASL